MDMLGLYQKLSADERRDLAARSGTTVEYLSQIAYGHRKAGPTLALAITRATAGAIRPYDLRPDAYPDPEWLPADVRAMNTPTAAPGGPGAGEPASGEPEADREAA